MKRLSAISVICFPAVLLGLLFTGAGRAPAADAPADDENACIICHREEDIWDKDTRRFYVADKHFGGDVHWRAGLRCQDCHGGDPAETDFRKAHAVDTGFRSVKSPADVPGFCGHCHSDNEYMRQFEPSPRVDQESQYWSSGHGQRLEQENDDKVATCTSCHHKPHGSGDDLEEPGILAVDDQKSPVYPTKVAETCKTCHADSKLMTGRTYHGSPIGHDQYAEWRQSVHAKAMFEQDDLSAPTCNDCHGNHGALPPDVDSVANACGSCHTKVAQLFMQTQMQHRFQEAGLPGCVTCHGKHDIGSPTDEMLGMGDSAVCAKCHREGKFGATPAGATEAKEMRASLDELKTQIDDVKLLVSKAERLGMEISGPRFDLRKANDALTNARTLIHTFAVDPVEEKLQEGFAVTAKVGKAAREALDDYTFRRVWLAASLAPILIVIVLLVFYIRSRPEPGTGRAGFSAPSADGGEMGPAAE